MPATPISIKRIAQILGVSPADLEPVSEQSRMPVVRLGAIGTSLVQHNNVATAAKVSHWSRGWLSWARVLSDNRFLCPIWQDPTVYVGWEPSGIFGATRFFRGLNAGVSGQFVGQIEPRKNYFVDNADVDMVFIDMGTNDVGSDSKENIVAARETVANYFLNNGITPIFLPILARDVSSWASGSASRKRAHFINQITRDFALSKRGVFFYDWNQAWVDWASVDGVPRSGLSDDGIHFSVLGGYAVGKDLTAYLNNILPQFPLRVYSPDDKYDAIDNPRGNMLANPACTGTTGTNGTGSSGTVATGMRVERATGTSTVVASKETRANGRGDFQVMTFTPAGAAEDLFYFRTAAADTTHTLPAGTWVQASVKVDVSAYNGWRGISMYLKDNGTNGLISYGLEPYDAGSGNLQWPTEAWSGTITTPPILLTSDSPSLRWRVEVRIQGNVAGSPVLKCGEVELRPVQDPRLIVAPQNKLIAS